VGKDTMEIVKVDEKGRIVIPKSLREKTEMKEGSCVAVKAKEKTILIQPLEPVAKKYFGAFTIAKWPKDIDEFVVEVMKEWWTPKAT
jgi:AbrB family looped-hinge helix DNA binding protein